MILGELFSVGVSSSLLHKKAGEKMARTIILLLDSFGIGYAHDAEAYGDKGADTLGHICDWLAKNPRHAGEAPKPLYLPHLAEHGLQAAAELSRGGKHFGTSGK